MAAVGAGHAALHQQRTTLGVDANDLQRLRRARHVAELTRHALSGKHAARILRHADRARRVVRARIAVRGTVRAEVVTLDHARETLALRRARHVDEVADLERVDADHAAHLALGEIARRNRKLAQQLATFDTGL